MDHADHGVRRLKYLRWARLLKIGPSCPREIIVKWAKSDAELADAFRLVHREYLRQGYLKKPQPSGMFYLRHHLLPTSSTVTIGVEDHVVGTLTHIRDTRDHGLPMDKIYREEVNALRAQGRTVAELSGLATDRQYRWQRLFMLLCRAVYRRAVEERVTDLCIIVNPRHAPFYKAIFLFEELGPPKTYPVLDAPAVGLRANLKTFKNRCRECYQSDRYDRNLFDFLHCEEADFERFLLYRNPSFPSGVAQWEEDMFLE